MGIVGGLPDDVMDDVVLDVSVNSVEVLLDCVVDDVCVGVLGIEVGRLLNDVLEAVVDVVIGLPDDVTDVVVGVISVGVLLASVEDDVAVVGDPELTEDRLL